jgi:hypothetical protein
VKKAVLISALFVLFGSGLAQAGVPEAPLSLAKASAQEAPLPSLGDLYGAIFASTPRPPSQTAICSASTTCGYGQRLSCVGTDCWAEPHCYVQCDEYIYFCSSPCP